MTDALDRLKRKLEEDKNPYEPDTPEYLIFDRILHANNSAISNEKERDKYHELARCQHKRAERYKIALEKLLEK